MPLRGSQHTCCRDAPTFALARNSWRSSAECHQKGGARQTDRFLLPMTRAPPPCQTFRKMGQTRRPRHDTTAPGEPKTTTSIMSDTTFQKRRCLGSVLVEEPERIIHRVKRRKRPQTSDTTIQTRRCLGSLLVEEPERTRTL